MVAARLQNVGEAHNVRLNVRARILQRVSNTGLRSKVNNTIKSFGSEKRIQRALVADIDAFECEIGMRRELTETSVFQPRCVVVVATVDADHFVVALE